MKHEDWKEQIKWGITAFSVLAAVSLVYVLVNNFYAVKQNLAVFTDFDADYIRCGFGLFNESCV